MFYNSRKKVRDVEEYSLTISVLNFRNNQIFEEVDLHHYVIMYSEIKIYNYFIVKKKSLQKIETIANVAK